jgi:hypothetical protein
MGLFHRSQVHATEYVAYGWGYLSDRSQVDSAEFVCGIWSQVTPLTLTSAEFDDIK